MYFNFTNLKVLLCVNTGPLTLLEAQATEGYYKTS